MIFWSLRKILFIIKVHIWEMKPIWPHHEYKYSPWLKAEKWQIMVPTKCWINTEMYLSKLWHQRYYCQLQTPSFNHAMVWWLFQLLLLESLEKETFQMSIIYSPWSNGLDENLKGLFQKIIWHCIYGTKVMVVKRCSTVTHPPPFN